MTNKFKNAVGLPLTKGLFFEMASKDDQILYTLKDADHRGYPSLYRLYMEMDDVTEYEFANKYLDGWSHWMTLCECEWFKPFVARWREEIDLRMKAKALALIRKEALEGGRNALAASKYLMERGWEDKGKKLLRKEHKEHVKQEADRILAEKEELQSAMDRMGLKLIENG